jgi:hypothetical protein
MKTEDRKTFRRWKVLGYDKFMTPEMNLLPNIELSWTNERPALRIELFFWGVVIWSDVRYS